MGLYDKTKVEAVGALRVLINLGSTLGERSEIESGSSNMTMEFSSSSCGFIRNLVKHGISLGCKEVDIPWRFN